MPRSFGDALKISEPVLASAGYCASYGFIGDKSEDHFSNQACHARLKDGYPMKDVKYYYTSFHTAKYAYGTTDIKNLNLKENDLTDFAKYCVGENSPFKMFLGDRNRELVFNNDGKATGVLLETSPEDDLDNLFAFSVMCRYINEKLPGYKLMLRLIGAGLHPSEAWYICHHFMTNSRGEGIQKATYYASGHTNFDSYKIDLKRLLEGNPHKGPCKVGEKLGYNTPKGYPTCTARFHQEGAKNVKPLIFSDMVKPSEQLKGRWSSTKGIIDIKAILTSWETFRNDLIPAAV